MVDEKYAVVWTRRSQQHMKQAFDYISKDSFQNAVKVLEDIVSAVNKAKLILKFTTRTNTNTTMMAVTGLSKNIITE